MRDMTKRYPVKEEGEYYYIKIERYSMKKKVK